MEQLLEVIQNFIIKYSVLISIVGPILTGIGTLWNYFFFERKKSELSKSVEFYRYQLQVSFLRVY